MTKTKKTKAPTKAGKKATSGAGAKSLPREARAAAPAPKTAEGSSEQAQAIALLQRPEGVLLTELMQASGWKRHSCRGFLSGVIGKKLGYRVASEKDGSNQRYKITGGGPAATAG